jgi:omega-hydroxy-beta-dihydromenaquinone-9 sulfotransferase
MDNMELSLSSPQEDEFALSASSLKSPCLAMVFPRQKERFERYLTLQELGEDEVAEWRVAFLTFLKKVQLRCGRPLVLKSPPHTARLRLLMELFPQARFIHIHRDPYQVFQSSRRTFRIMFDWHGLQRPKLDDLDEWVLRQYRQMYAAYFAEKHLVPPGQFHELAFEQLEADPVREVRKIYEVLSFPPFEGFEPTLREYVDSLRGYRKNSFPELSLDLKTRISQEWKQCFHEWGYNLQPAQPVSAA